MAESELSYKSLTKHVVGEMLRELESCPEFDSETIERLKKLAADGQLTNAALVAQGIQPTVREEIDESPGA